MNNLLALPVLLPLFGAALALVSGRRPRAQRVASVTTLGIAVVVAATLVYLTSVRGPLVLWIGDWPRPLGIALVADRLSALMLLVSAVITLAVLVFSFSSDRTEHARRPPVSIFHPTFLVLNAGVSDAFLAGDLFNMFVGFEMLLFASYVLITLGGTGERVRAGSTYLVVNLFSSTLFLIAIAVTYAAAGTVNLAQLSLRIGNLPVDLQALLHYLLLIVFCIKAAVFPLSAWLADSYPTAPAPVTAVFAGLLTKVGVYAVIRTQTLLFDDRNLTGLLATAALLTMIIGILGAVAQTEIKRMLSLTLVSHIGYMIFGVSLASQAGFAGAIFYIVHHIVIQTTLFLVAGLIEERGGSTSLGELGGLATSAPFIGVLFFIPAMNLSGIPPLSGFIAKVGLLRGGIADGSWLSYLLVAGGLMTSLLTLYAMAKVWNRAFWREPPLGPRRLPDPVGESAAEHGAADADGTTGPDGAVATGVVASSRVNVTTAAVLVVLGLGLTVVAGPLYHYTDRAAADLLTPAQYVHAVLPKGVR